MAKSQNFSHEKHQTYAEDGEPIVEQPARSEIIDENREEKKGHLGRGDDAVVGVNEQLRRHDVVVGVSIQVLDILGQRLDARVHGIHRLESEGGDDRD